VEGNFGRFFLLIRLENIALKYKFNVVNQPIRMENLIIFGILSIPIIVVSWRSLFSIKTHGFYRFLSWECILGLLVSNYRFWFIDPFSFHQIISWIFLFYASYLVITGAIKLKKAKKDDSVRSEENLYQFEKTSELIDTGIFKFIRHPLYSSLLFLTWGICLKNVTGFLIIISLLSSIALLTTALRDEKECIAYFGDKYIDYMKRTKMFIPFII
jgi:protein-S-isoprenylcysteine O-methyltransferase Ste14